MARPGWRAPVPVLCVGNATAGGSGKTPVALDLGARWERRGVVVHVLLRGHGGRTRGPLRVDPSRHDARHVGDEALLHAAHRPTWVAASRAEGARAAVAAGAQALLLDDGLQHASLIQDAALLVIDGGSGFGNGRVIPAGPLREPPAAAAARAGAAVLIGADAHGALAALPPGLPVWRAALRPGPDAAAFAGQRVFAFCGIGRPEKFFATLGSTGAIVVGSAAFADHHRYDRADLLRLSAAATRLHAQLITTTKDAMRLPASVRPAVAVLTVQLVWDDPRLPDTLLSALPSHADRPDG